MKSAPIFDLLTTPLSTGVNLIEASAGTGKTYAITGLYLRLIIEQKLDVSEILVVTFTEAATQELRDRVRAMLSAALEAFTIGTTASPLLQGLLKRHSRSRASIIPLLKKALTGFDEATIYTIHGFCQRTLKDRAFETGELFDTELILDQSMLLQEIAADFWRQEFHHATPLEIAVAMENKLGPETLLPLARICLSHPFLKLIGPPGSSDWSALRLKLESDFRELQTQWAETKAVIRPFFGTGIKWGNRPYNSGETINPLFAHLDQGFGGEASQETLKALQQFTPEAMMEKKSGRYAGQIPTHSFFEISRQFCTTTHHFAVGVQLAFFKFVHEELSRRKRVQKIQAFDDLLLRLFQALEGAKGKDLAAVLRKRQRAALIDEFQDTDPVQHSIFRMIFSTPETFLYLIGDPKQAIYGFRGADIFTYLDAIAKAKAHYTLRENWRSESGLVRAVNTIFQTSNDPFIFPEIKFTPLEAKGPANDVPLQESGGRRDAPFHLWLGREAAEQISKGALEEKMPGVVAAEISRLLQSDLRIGDSPLLPEDLAVLVLENRQAQAMQQALTALHIPSVLHTTASLFASREAAECERLLAAVEQPGNDRRLRAALSTDILGVNARALEELGEDERLGQSWLERFLDYSSRWTSDGFIQMFRLLLQRENVRSRLLTFPDGERRLTNLLHLAEVLHETATTRRLGPAGLLKWLAEQRSAESIPADEHQLRLERDDRAVQLVTVHKSKGLEYNIVFCPYTPTVSRRARNDDEGIVFHEFVPGHPLAMDLGGPDYDRNRQLASKEKLAEHVRLIYVALTRARHRCYFAWTELKDSQNSAAARLLHPSGNDSETSGAEGHLTIETMRADLDALVVRSHVGHALPAIKIGDVPSDEAPVYTARGQTDLPLHPRHFTRAIRRTGGIASFSSLVSGQRDEAPDRDAVEVRVPLEVPASGIFAFPRGAKAGTCLHKILELLDFTRSDPGQLNQLVRDQLRGHRFDEDEFSQPLILTLDKVISIPIEPTRGAVTFSRIGAADRLNELEFCFPVQHLSPAGLNAFFNDHGFGAPGQAFEIDKLTFNPVSGFLKGFIDLVFQSEGRFYFADWKSNWLGNSPADYGPLAMNEEMQVHHYHLQLLIYTVALHQYLSTRIPGYRYETHFGGAVYVFLRGLEPSRPDLGVYRSRPPFMVVQELAEFFSGKGEAHERR